MRIQLIFWLWILCAAFLRADESPGIKVLSCSKERIAKVVISNPSDAPIYFQTPLGSISGSIEVLEGAKWIAQKGSWCGTGQGFTKLSAGENVTYDVQVGTWIPVGQVRFRFHVWFVSEAGYKSMFQEHRLERVKSISIYSEPVDT